jgi:YjbE family integral membrane protein
MLPGTLATVSALSFFAPAGLVFPGPEFWGRWAGIVLIDLALAGDNALVIAMAVRLLPARSQALGAMWGTLGALLLRIVFTLGAAPLLRLSIVQFVGGLLLFWIAVKLVRPQSKDVRRVRRGRTVLEAIWIIALADFVMSLDNVLAVAAAARGNAVLIVFGVLLSLPLVVWGSSAIAGLMNRHPWVLALGGGILGAVAGELMLRDPFFERWLDALAAPGVLSAVPVMLGLMIVIVWWRLRQHTSSFRGASGGRPMGGCPKQPSGRPSRSTPRSHPP